MSSLEMFGLFFRYSCSCSYLSVKKVLSWSFCWSDRFSSPPSRFNSLAMLLSSSGVMLLLFLGRVSCTSGKTVEQRMGGMDVRQRSRYVRVSGLSTPDNVANGLSV